MVMPSKRSSVNSNLNWKWRHRLQQHLGSKIFNQTTQLKIQKTAHQNKSKIDIISARTWKCHLCWYHLFSFLWLSQTFILSFEYYAIQNKNLQYYYRWSLTTCILSVSSSNRSFTFFFDQMFTRNWEGHFSKWPATKKYVECVLCNHGRTIKKNAYK